VECGRVWEWWMGDESGRIGDWRTLLNLFGVEMGMHYVRLNLREVWAVGRATVVLRFCGGVLDLKTFAKVEVEPIGKSRYFVN
jgi:hypothetical protein